MHPPSRGRPRWRRWSTSSTRPTFAAIQHGLADPDPMVRLAAVGALGSVDPQLRARAAAAPARRSGPRRPPGSRPGAGAGAHPRPAAGPARRGSTPRSPTTRPRRATLVERPEGLITLANFYRDRGRLAEAEARLADSIRLHPGFVPAYANLADLMRQQGRDGEGERILQQGLAVAPRSAELHHAIGPAADPPAEVPRGRGRAGRGRELGARQSPLRLCLRRGAAGDRPARRGGRGAGAGRRAAIPPTRTSCSPWPPRCCSRATSPVRAATPRRWSGSPRPIPMRSELLRAASPGGG